MIGVLKKELAEHGGVFLAVTALLLLIVVRQAAMVEGRGLDPIDTMRVTLLSLVPVLAFTLGSRLLTSEYMGETQLFLEGLPVGRLEVLVVKLGVGLVVLAAWTFLLVLGFGEGATSGLPRDLFAVLTLRAMLYGLAWSGIVAPFSLLGRFRWAVACLVGVVVSILAAKLGVTGTELFPFSLLDPSSGDSTSLPPELAARAVALAVVGTGLAGALVLVREGDLPSRLGGKLSLRERATFVVVAAALVLALYVDDQRREKAPFRLEGAMTGERGGARVEVAGGPSGDAEEARIWLERTLEIVTTIRDGLGLERMSPVHVTLRRELDRGRFQVGKLDDRSGVPVRTNPDLADEQRAAFARFLTKALVEDHSHGRALLEERLWLFDGLGLFSFPPADPAPFRRLAAWAQLDLERGELDAWLRFRERVGLDAAEATAWCLLEALAEARGREAVASALRARFGPQRPKGLHGTLEDPSTDALLTEALGLDRAGRSAVFREALATPPLAPRLSAVLEQDRLTEWSHRLGARLVVTSTWAASHPVVLRWVELDLETAWPPKEAERVLITTLEQARDVVWIPRSFSPGARVRWTFAVDVPGFGGELVSGWQREVVP